jgi:hypothetical protein
MCKLEFERRLNTTQTLGKRSDSRLCNPVTSFQLDLIEPYFQIQIEQYSILMSDVLEHIILSVNMPYYISWSHGWYSAHVLLNFLAVL